jgi:hypothetical protein
VRFRLKLSTRCAQTESHMSAMKLVFVEVSLIQTDCVPTTVEQILSLLAGGA